jgi:hypothetical protein
LQLSLGKQQVYRQLGYGSLFAYTTQELKPSEAVAYMFIQVARKAKEIPELKEAINQGEITISKAQRVASVLTPENQNELLAMARTLPKRELEKEVAKLNPLAVVPEKARYVTEERLELKLGISEEVMKKLRRVQDLLATKKRRVVNLEVALSAMAEEYLEKHDPLEKAKRTTMRQKNQPEAPTPLSIQGEAFGNQVCPGKVTPMLNMSSALNLLEGNVAKNNPQHYQRPAIPAKVEHEVILRDEAQCTYFDHHGKRCDQQRWLHRHHILPKTYGGNDATDNLTLLCAGHHKMVHQGFNHTSKMKVSTGL